MSRFYGFDAGGLSRADLFSLEANILSVWAEEVLRERGGSVSAAELRWLTYLVTGSWLEADLAYSRRVLEERNARNARVDR